MTAYNNYCLGLENNTPPQGGSLFVSICHPTILLNNWESWGELVSVKGLFGDGSQPYGGRW